MTLNPQRTIDELKQLRALTGNENGAQRVAWTDTWQTARHWFAEKLKDLPVEHHYDAAANNWVTLPGKSEKSLLIGGHLDTVPVNDNLPSRREGDLRFLVQEPVTSGSPHAG